VDQAAQHLIKEGSVLREESVEAAIDPTDPEYVLFRAVVQRVVVNPKTGESCLLDKAIGTKRQWTKMRLKSGDVVKDPFWYEKGSMKAIRNAKVRLLPESIKSAIITKAKKLGKVKDIEREEYPEKPRKREVFAAYSEAILEAQSMAELSKVGNEIQKNKHNLDPDELETLMDMFKLRRKELANLESQGEQG